jgi:uncharacterized RDD family membrane protein YckC
MTTLAMEYPETMTSMTTATPALAGRGARLGAALLDLLIFSVFLIPGIWIMSSSDSDMGKGFGGAFLVVGWLGLLVTQMVFLVIRGQSLGKMAVGIKIVRVADGSVPGFVKVVLLRMFVPSLLAAIPYAGALIWFADVLFIFRDDRRCLHDLIAETKVVDVPEKTPEATVSSQHQTTDLRPRTNSIESDQPLEAHWAKAIEEFDGKDRNAALYAKLFANNDGDEAHTKADYLRERAFALRQALDIENARRYLTSKGYTITEFSGPNEKSNMSSESLVNLARSVRASNNFP